MLLRPSCWLCVISDQGCLWITTSIFLFRENRRMHEFEYCTCAMQEMTWKSLQPLLFPSCQHNLFCRQCPDRKKATWLVMCWPLYILFSIIALKKWGENCHCNYLYFWNPFSWCTSKTCFLCLLIRYIVTIPLPSLT